MKAWFRAVHALLITSKTLTPLLLVSVAGVCC
jgi:hypothetical protein